MTEDCRPIQRWMIRRTAETGYILICKRFIITVS